MSKTRKMPVFQKQSCLIKNNLKKKKTQELWSGTSFLDQPPAKIIAPWALVTRFYPVLLKLPPHVRRRCASPHLLPPIIFLDCKTAGWDKTEETIMQLSDVFFLLLEPMIRQQVYILYTPPSVRVRSISAHYLTDMTVVLRSSAIDQSVCSSCCFHYNRCKLGGKKGRKLISSTSRSDSWDLNQLGLQSKARFVLQPFFNSAPF